MEVKCKSISAQNWQTVFMFLRQQIIFYDNPLRPPGLGLYTVFAALIPGVAPLTLITEPVS